MTGKVFMNAVADGQEDVLQVLLDALSRLAVEYCVIDGLAVNAYAEPVVSLDLDIVVAADDVEKLRKTAAEAFNVERLEHSINLTSAKSDLRIQLQTDARYQEFMPKAVVRTILGYEMKVACVEDVLRGKIWAYADEQRRRSKRQKDLTDILRLVEAYPELEETLPESVRDSWILRP